VTQLTLIADLDDILHSPPREAPDYTVRGTSAADRDLLADLYLAAYAGSFVKDREEAREELRLTFEGEYGPFDLEASPIALHAGQAAAGVLTVTEAPWHDTPTGPFIIEVMVHPDHRRKGLARFLIQTAARCLKARGATTVALRVLAENRGAVRLYEQLGFRQI
jgi:GNAT superfamily N-acetyltransferase